jgi:hypothetical protein
MATKFLAVQRQYPEKSSVYPIAEGETLLIEGVGEMRITFDELGFGILQFSSGTIGRHVDPYKLHWTSPLTSFPLIGLYDSEEQAWRAMLHESHGRLAALLGVDNTFEAVEAELRRQQEESVEEEAWRMSDDAGIKGYGGGRSGN